MDTELFQHMRWLHFIRTFPPYIFLCNTELALIPIAILVLHAMIRVCVLYTHTRVVSFLKTDDALSRL